MYHSQNIDGTRLSLGAHTKQYWRLKWKFGEILLRHHFSLDEQRLPNYPGKTSTVPLHLLGPFHVAIAVSSVTRCRCRRRHCRCRRRCRCRCRRGHRCAGGARQYRLSLIHI